MRDAERDQHAARRAHRRAGRGTAPACRRRPRTPPPRRRPRRTSPSGASTSSTIASPDAGVRDPPGARTPARARGRPAASSNAEYTDMEPRRLSGVQLPAPFRLEDDQIVADLPHARAVFSHGARRRVERAVRQPQPRDAHRGREGERRREPAPAGRARRPPVAALLLRPPGPRQPRPARHRAAVAPTRPYTEEDGQATALDDAAAIVFVADCLPILLAADGAVAALHGGWRPLAGGIVDEGVAALREVGGDGPITAALGPSARGCCYEVSDEVHAQLRGLRRAAGPEPRHRRRRPRSSSRRTGSRSTTSACARSAPSAARCSPIAATRASPAARRGSCAGPERRARVRENLDADPRGDRRRRRDPRRGQVRAAARSSTCWRGRRDAARREPRAGPGGEGRALPRLPLALHRPAPVAQGQADRPARGADPLGRVGVRAAPARAPRRAADSRSCSRSTSPARRARPGSIRPSSRAISSCRR